MSSLHEHRPGRWRLKFTVEKKPRVIYLPKGARAAARTLFLTRFDELISCKVINSAYPPDLMQWLAGLSHEILARLSAFGLVAYRVTADLTIAAVVDQYIARRSDFLAANTLKILRQTRTKLVTFLGGDMLVKDITAAHASDFAEQIGGSLSTRRTYVATTKRVLKDAVKRELIKVNPFEAESGAIPANPERSRFITREVVSRVMDFCDPELQLVVALSRYAGLRIPSECNDLEWDDVIWGDRLVIRKHKTKPRAVPLFPELVPYLQRAFEAAEPGATQVIVNKSASYRLAHAIKRSGVEPWPRQFHNMRASRQTELTEQYPDHVVCTWLGNSKKIAEAHYLQVTDAHFEQAARPEARPESPPNTPEPNNSKTTQTLETPKNKANGVSS